MTRARVPLVLAAAALVLGAGAFGARARAIDERAVAEAARRRSHAVEVAAIRTRLEQAHLDETNLVLLHELFGAADADQVAAATREREETRREAITALERLVRHDDPAARKATDLLSAIRNDGIDELAADEVPPDLLSYAADLDLAIGASTYPGPAAEVRPDLDDLARVASTGGWVLNRAIDRAYLADRPDAPRAFDDYLELVERFGDAGGFLAIGEEDPLLRSALLLEEPEPTAALRRIQSTVLRSPVAAYDEWMTDAYDRVDVGEAPTSIERLAAAAAELDLAVRRTVAGELASATTATSAAAEAADDRSDRWALAASLLALAATAAAAGAVAIVIARARRDARRATTDPLTGAGNRHLLAEATTAWLGDADLRWHLLAVIDLDRFKLVNDTWGHAAGDALLVRVARELQGVVADLRSERAVERGAVIRMGGDEFLVSLHGARPLDPEDVHRRLDAVRSSTLRLADGTAVPLRFSIGIASAEGPTALDDLERAADLASYEDKATRAQRSGDAVTPSTGAPDAAASTR